jgi:Prokaryotic RING finger family 1
MAHIWTMERETGEWAVHSLAGAEAFRLCDRGVEPVGTAEAPAGPLLQRYRTALHTHDQWALLLEPGTRIHANGEAVETGIRVLRNRDMVKLGNGLELVFSTEDLPAVVAVPSERIGTRCARCTRPFGADDRVVVCPRCATSHHAMEALPCWNALPGCAACGASTSGDEYAWTPESL